VATPLTGRPLSASSLKWRKTFFNSICGLFVSDLALALLTFHFQNYKKVIKTNTSQSTSKINLILEIKFQGRFPVTQ
jgi:hypothetical protein